MLRVDTSHPMGQQGGNPAKTFSSSVNEEMMKQASHGKSGRAFSIIDNIPEKRTRLDYVE